MIAADTEDWTYCSIQGGFDFVASPIDSDKVLLLLQQIVYSSYIDTRRKLNETKTHIARSANGYKNANINPNVFESNVWFIDGGSRCWMCPVSSAHQYHSGAFPVCSPGKSGRQTFSMHALLSLRSVARNFSLPLHNIKCIFRHDSVTKPQQSGGGNHCLGTF